VTSDAGFGRVSMIGAARRWPIALIAVVFPAVPGASLIFKALQDGPFAD